MIKEITITRDQAEVLVELLMLTDHAQSLELSDVLRSEFAMVSEQEELEHSGKTKNELRIEFALQLIRSTT